MRGFAALVASTLLLLALTPPSGPSAASVLDRVGPQASFTGDLCADLVVGVPHEDIGEASDTGAFNVLYGAYPAGLPGGGEDLWGQFANTSESGDTFGHALAAGDFDGDGYIDLAVGMPYEDIEGTTVVTDAGTVEVWYGSAGGLDSSSAVLWHQDVGSIQSLCEVGDSFGYALAAGDFDRDGYTDLAVGLPYEDWNLENAGIVQILYGTSSGLSDVGNQLWRQGDGGITEPEEAGDQFGEVLTVGDFDGDGYADLAIGVPNEDFETPSSISSPGLVHILYGSDEGLVSDDWQIWQQLDPEHFDIFGAALASGYFNDDGYADLAVGAPWEDLEDPDVNGAGSVSIIYGSPTGLVAGGSQVWDRGDGAEAGANFGFALSAGDYNGDGRDDLAVGIPYEDIVDILDAGAVEILYGAHLGLVRRVSNDFWHQDRSGMEDGPEGGDDFGYSLASGDFDGDGYADLAIGVPYEDIPGAGNSAGAVHVLYGSAGGIAAADNRFFHQGLPDIEGQAEEMDHFGWAVVALLPPRHRLFLPIVVRGW